MVVAKAATTENHRTALGSALPIIGRETPRTFVLCPDLSKTTGAARFRDAFPDRFLSTGVSEMHTVGLAAGLALEGFIPIVVGFGMFVVGKAWEPLRNSVAYPRLNLKVIATHCGLNVGPDGVTHQMIEDLALTRAMPGFSVFAPADGPQVLPVLRAALEIDGPVYIRLERDDMKVVTEAGRTVAPGKGQCLRDGSDVSIIAIGSMVGRAMEAAGTLSERGISTRVINMVSVKPLDNDIIIEAANETGAIVTAEDHNRYGGLGSAVAQCLAEASCSVAFEMVAINDTYGQSGDRDQLYRMYGIDTDAILSAVFRVVSHRKGKGKQR